MVSDDEVVTEAMKLATKLASGPTLAYGKVKELLNSSFDHALETQMEYESRSIAGLIETGDGQEGIHAFLDKRKPDFKGN